MGWTEPNMSKYSDDAIPGFWTHRGKRVCVDCATELAGMVYPISKYCHKISKCGTNKKSDDCTPILRRL